MPRQITTTGRIFRARLAVLVESQGIERQQQQYGVTRRTIRRWMAGETTPSQARRESVRRRGLTAGAPQALQVRRAGRFTAEGTVASGGSQRAVQSINRNLRRIRDARIESARRRGSARAMEEARARPTRLTAPEARSFMLGRERLVESAGSGERPVPQRLQTEPPPREPGLAVDEEDEWGPATEWDLYYDLEYPDWEAWRSDYEQRAG